MIDDCVLVDAFALFVAECNKPTVSKTAIKDFERVLSKANKAQIAWFRDVYATELTITSSKSKHIKKLFNKSSQSTKHVAFLFENFIKGITYFSNEQAHPIYHRLFPCGSNTSKLVCTKAGLARSRPLIEQCYVERIIYNEICRQESGFQEKDLFRIDLTQKEFETHFPNTKIALS